MHNNDIMHQEHKVGESILSTCMRFMDKTDNQKARKDLAPLCNWPTLELTTSGGKPCALFCLKPKERKKSIDLVAKFKISYGYIASFRRAVNLELGKLSGVKSHDYHIFTERLLPVIFHGYLNDDVWKALDELSNFYRQLCAKKLRKR
jgi:hypothetical protein